MGGNLKYLAFANTKLGFIKLVLVSLLLSYVAVVLGTSEAPGKVINQQNADYDIRLSGINDNFWSTPDFSFYEPHISSFASKINLGLECGDGKPCDPSNFEVSINGTPASAKPIPGTKNIEITWPSFSATAGGSGIFVKVKSLKPIASKESGKFIGAKFVNLQILPSAVLLFPTLDFAFFPIISLAILLVLVCFTGLGKIDSHFSIMPIVIGALLGAITFSINRFDYWSRAAWIWIFLVCLLMGVILFNNFFKSNKSKQDIFTGNFWLLIGSIVLLAFAIRFYNLNFGQPGFFHPDEGNKIKRMLNMVSTGDLNPHYFRHPSFLLYAGAFLSWICSLVTGNIPSLQTINYLGRSVSASLGALSVVLTYLIAARIFSRQTGLLASVLLAFSPLHVVCSRYIKEDASLVFFTLLSFYFMLRALDERGRLRFLALSALSAGVSASCKYSGLISLIFPLVPIFDLALAWLIQNYSWAMKLSFLQFSKGEKVTADTVFVYAGIVASLFVLGFILVSPYTVLDTAQFFKDFNGEKTHMEKGHTVPITALSYYWSYHLKFSVIPALRGLAPYLSFLACGFLLARGKPRDLLIVGAILTFYLPAEWVKAKPQPQPERYILPCIPFLCVALAEFVECFRKVILSRFQFRKLIYSLSVLIILFPCCYYSIAHAVNMKDDTRLEAKKWILKNIPLNSKLLIDWRYYSPPGLSSKYQILEFKQPEGKKIFGKFSLETLKQTGYDYLIISSFSYGRYIDPIYRGHFLSKRFHEFFAEIKPVAVFDNSTYSYGFHNPTILIFSLR